MKTIEKASKEYSKSMSDILNKKPFLLSEINYILENAYRKGAEDVQSWISVEEELPEVKNHGFSDLVLTKNSYDNIMLERYDSESKQFNGIRYDCIKNNDGQVTHWRPIDRK